MATAKTKQADDRTKQAEKQDSKPEEKRDQRLAKEQPEGPQPEKQVGSAKRGRDKAREDKHDREESFGPGVVHGGDGYQVDPPEETDLEGPPNGRPDDGVFVTVHNRRSDADLIQGQFVEITEGDHKGRSGAYLFPVEFGEDRYPSKILVRTSDDDAQQIVVLAKHARLKSSPR